MNYWILPVFDAQWRQMAQADWQSVTFHHTFPPGKKFPRKGDVLICLSKSAGAWVGAIALGRRVGHQHDGNLTNFESSPVPDLQMGAISVPAKAPGTLVSSLESRLADSSPRLFRNKADALLIVDLLREASRKSAGQNALAQIPVPAELRQACSNGECVAFVGPGLSAPASLPTWGPLVEGLLKWSAKHAMFTPEEYESLEEATKQRDYESVADMVVSRISDPAELAGYLRKVFSTERLPIPQAHSLLPRLPFSAILTTNFDDFIERSYTGLLPIYTPNDTESLQSAHIASKPYILKLYGTYARPETILVDPAHFRTAMASNIPFTRYMQGLFLSRTMLFIGASLEGISGYLDGLNLRADGGTTRQHFAVLAVNGNSWRPKADQLLRRYGIRVIPYSRTSEKQLTEFLEQLRPPRIGQHVKMGALQRSSYLKSIHLESVGPFDDLHLDFDPGCNVIVGDNGVGKSAILKAIAAAIAGEDSQPYAHRLVKKGRKDATITLETDRGTRYVTRLYLTDKESAVVETRPGRALEAESWLALGFPALRMVSWQSAGEYSSEGPARAQARDLLPLLTGEPDSRMDDLKRWLLNFDKRTRSRNPRSRKFRDEFQNVIERLLPHETVKFAGIDREKGRVLIQTPEGELPLEAVSQGATSFMGWMGVVLQRLYDFYSPEAGSANPLEQFALVLVDEIDAHMHPGWQRTVVGDVQSICPNAQLIATTHSPLIVNNLERDQVVALKRGMPPRRPDGSLKGYRADQILTLPLFDLSSTMSVGSEKALERYSRLLGKPDRSPDEEKELADLTRAVGLDWPSEPESPKSREALAQLEQLAFARIQALPPERRQALIEESTRTLEQREAASP